jgi:hypothetical protein
MQEDDTLKLRRQLEMMIQNRLLPRSDEARDSVRLTHMQSMLA